MAYTINTNIASLQAQDYLRVNSDFQNKTINRVTSGLRIINSGDDAAGLAIANTFRSDRSVLTQGIRNANDGLSTLQTIDAGINNISQLLDRARTLAAQSASGTFTGSRSVLNNEFTSVLGEIDRQAQAIGLDTGGKFAKSLSVFVGGGKTNNGIDSIVNGSVSVDLSNSAVDAKSLGLKGVQVVGKSAVDLSAGQATSVQNILANQTNTLSESSGGFTDFYFRGPGFSDSNAIRVSVNTAGVNDTSTLVTALNAAIQSAGNGTNSSATAFKNAGIQASVVTDSTGQHLAFTSSTAAFQVEAGDRMSNALLGNLSGTTGSPITTTVTASAASDTGTNTFGAIGAGTIKFRFQGASQTAPVDISLTVTSAETVTQAIADLSSQVTNNASLQAAGIKLTTNTGTLQFTSTRGEKFDVQVTGDVRNKLGFGSFQTGNAGEFDYSSLQAAAAYDRTTAKGTATYEFSLNGGASSTNQVTVDLAGGNATKASVTGTNAAATVDTATGSNTSLDIAIDGTVYNVTGIVSSATAQKAAIATTIQTALGGAATVSVVSNHIVIESASKGTNSSVQFLNSGATDAAAVLGFTVGTKYSGQARSVDDAVNEINQQFSTNSTLQAAGMKASYSGTTITFTSTNDTAFRLDAHGTTQAGQVLGTAAQNFTFTSGTDDAMSISVDGGTAQVIAIGTQAGATAAAIAGIIQGQLTGATVTADHGHLKIVSNNTGTGASIAINTASNNAYTKLGLTASTTVTGSNADLGFGVVGVSAFAGNDPGNAPATSPLLNSGGASQTGELVFNPILYGSDGQTITVTGVDSSGVEKSQNILLQNATGVGNLRNARTIDEAVHTINTALQQSNIPTLQKIVAVKDDAAGVEKIRFMSAGGTFKVTVGTNANADGVGGQGATETSEVSDGGSTSDISTQANAQSAVTALANAVGLLGQSQAVVGKGQNQFGYAVNLASSQLSNLAAAESRIRDADLAAEAANMTKAQILAQAGIAALAQANSAPQAVLSLLRG